MATTNYCLRLAYDGRDFSGYQVQPKERTVQGELEKTLSYLFKEEISLQASGRTDAGVHALEQVVSFKACPLLKEERLLYALNRLLPRDIKVLRAEKVHEDFHPRFDALGKVYRYKCSYEDRLFERPYVLYLKKRVALEKIKEAAGFLVGEKDFYNFSNRRKEEGSTVRHLYRLKVEEKEDGFDLVFVGDGFLYKMVRIMVAYLLEVGQGRIPPEKTEEILKQRDRKYTRKVAPPQGLILEKVFYSKSELENFLLELDSRLN